ncbi:MAG: hypothetical protein FWD57_11910, partial [Polyangiaceae bacterium]|nr:hypothetical protein [Polyangiaceae bacterium]
VTPGCECWDVCGRAKFACVAEAKSSDKLNQTSSDFRNALNAAVLELDNVGVLPPSSCSPPCKATEDCFKRTVHPQVAASQCPTGSCSSGLNCYQTAQSGSNMFNCLTPNACSPKRKPFHPIADLFTCE